MYVQQYYRLQCDPPTISDTAVSTHVTLPRHCCFGVSRSASPARHAGGGTTPRSRAPTSSWSKASPALGPALYAGGQGLRCRGQPPPEPQRPRGLEGFLERRGRYETPQMPHHPAIKLVQYLGLIDRGWPRPAEFFFKTPPKHAAGPRDRPCRP